MHTEIKISELVGDTDDEFLKAALLAAGRFGCVFHEEIGGAMRAITSGERGAARFVRFTLILPDTRLVSTAQWRPRREALLAVCRAAVPYLQEIAEWEKFSRNLHC